MTLQEFEQQVFAAALASSISDIPFVRTLTATAISLRILLITPTLVDPTFIDAFYNEQTGTTAYALISESKRIFGADNTGGWHVHPFSDPTQHVPIPQPMTFAEFMAAVEKHL